MLHVCHLNVMLKKIQFFKSQNRYTVEYWNKLGLTTKKDCTWAFKRGEVIDSDICGYGHCTECEFLLSVQNTVISKNTN